MFYIPVSHPYSATVAKKIICLLLYPRVNCVIIKLIKFQNIGMYDNQIFTQNIGGHTRDGVYKFEFQ